MDSFKIIKITGNLHKLQPWCWNVVRCNYNKFSWLSNPQGVFLSDVLLLCDFVTAKGTLSRIPLVSALQTLEANQ